MFGAYQFLSDLYYVATTRFVGLRLFMLLVEFISVSLYISLSGLFPVVLGLMPSLISVRRIAILFSRSHKSILNLKLF